MVTGEVAARKISKIRKERQNRSKDLVMRAPLGWIPTVLSAYDSLLRDSEDDYILWA